MQASETTKQFNFAEEISLQQAPQQQNTVEKQQEELPVKMPLVKQEPIVLENTNNLVETKEYFLPIGEEAKSMSQWAKVVAKSPYYLKEGGECGIISKWLFAKELGISPMAALNGGLYYVQGQITISATTMSALIRKRGHSIQVVQKDANVCHIKGKRRDTGDTGESIFTIEMAKAANLTGKGGPWKSYPERMLFNRALSNLAKDLFADCIHGERDDDFEDCDSVEAVPEEKPLSKQTADFIERHNLLSEDNDISKFIDRIASTLSKDRIDVIADAANDEEKFLNSLEKFRKNK